MAAALIADGFRNYLRAGHRKPTEELLVERAKHADADRSRDDGSRRRHAGAERQLRTIPTWHLGSFCAGGVLAKHPRLRVAFLEANCSWLPWLLWRLDEGWEREGDIWAPDLTTAPSEYFKRQCVISVEPDEATVKHVIDYMGGKTIDFSTDYPHGDSRYPEAVDHFLKLPISDDDKRKILWDNCAAYYAM